MSQAVPPGLERIGTKRHAAQDHLAGGTRARSASTFGSRSPAISACNIARPETPRMSVATTRLLRTRDDLDARRFEPAGESQSTAVRALVPSRAGAAGGVRETGDAELNGLDAAGGDLVHLGEFGAGAARVRGEPTRPSRRGAVITRAHLPSKGSGGSSPKSRSGWPGCPAELSGQPS